MQFTYLGGFVKVDIRKPMSSTHQYDFCRVNKEYFDKARKTGRYLLVRTPNGERVILPKGWKGKIVKEVFLFPNNPMKMYEVIVPKCEKKPDEYYIFSSGA